MYGPFCGEITLICLDLRTPLTTYTNVQVPFVVALITIPFETLVSAGRFRCTQPQKHFGKGRHSLHDIPLRLVFVEASMSNDPHLFRRPTTSVKPSSSIFGCIFSFDALAIAGACSISTSSPLSSSISTLSQSVSSSFSALCTC